MTPEEHRTGMIARKNKSVLGREEKKAYNLVKKEVLEHEEDNFSKLYVVKAPGGWYKVFEHSAIIYAHDLAMRLGKRIIIYPDTDYNYVAKIGVASFKDFEKFKKDMFSLKVKLVHDDARVAVFHLGYSVTPESINGYLKEDEEARRRTEKMLVPEKIFPKLKQELRLLNETVWHASQKMTEWNKQMLGREMTEITKAAYRNFLLMARGWKDADLFFSETQRRMEDLKCDVAIAESLRIFDVEKTYKISLQIATVEKTLIKSAGQLQDDRKREEAEKRAIAEGRKLAKRSEVRDKVLEKTGGGK